jgi:hypothetical protein
MAQVVIRYPLTAEACVHVHVSRCDICGGQSGTRTGFSEFFGLIHQYHTTRAPYSY